MNEQLCIDIIVENGGKIYRKVIEYLGNEEEIMTCVNYLIKNHNYVHIG